MNSNIISSKENELDQMEITLLNENKKLDSLSDLEEISNASKQDIKGNSSIVSSEIEVISDEEIEEANNFLDESVLLRSSRIQDVSNSSSDEESFKNVQKRKKKKVNLREPGLFKNKVNRIESVLTSEPTDLEILRELAVQDGGLVKDYLRRRAWPHLMQVNKIEFSPKPPLETIKLHKDYDQVVMDVNRSLKRFPPGIDEEYRYILMNQLTTLIIRVLEKHPHLNYYQGYHDVAITFLLVMGEAVGFELVERLSLTHLQEFMRPSMDRTTYYLTYLYPVLKRANRNLYDFLIKSNVGTVFCLPWLITWYAHTLSDYRNVVRLYDFFLATPYLMPMYIAVAIVLHKEKDILAEECDMAMQHFVLSQVPDSLPFEDILKKASELYSLYPPDEMQEEVEEMVKKKAIEEEEERKKAILRRRNRSVAAPKSSRIFDLVTSISERLHISDRHRNIVKVFAFAFTATLATGLYGYYSNSPYLKSYLPWS